MSPLLRVVAVALAVVAGILTDARDARAATSATVGITNTASLAYSDTLGATYLSTSNTVAVALVAAVCVTPKETVPNAATDLYITGAQQHLTFNITNTGNATETFRISSLTTNAGTIDGVAFATANGNVPTSVGGIASPPIAPGSSINAIVTLTTTGVALGTQILVNLGASATVGSAALSDTGSIFRVPNSAPVFSGPGGGSTSAVKLVNNLPQTHAAPGDTVTFSIAFQNSGTASATNVSVTDPLPTGLSLVPGSVKLNGAAPPVAPAISGQTLSLTLATLAPNTVQTLTFDAKIDANASLGSTIVNVASMGSDGVPPTRSTPASVFIGRADIVFDGYGGSSLPVTGASVTVVDAQTMQPVRLAGTAPSLNATNANPFSTSKDGRYAFGLGTQQFGGSSYLIVVRAAGYRPRQIALHLQPSSQFPDLDYDATLHALDGQPLAVAGAFTLSDADVVVRNVSGVFGNLPLFAPATLTITKTAERSTATAGDRVVFTVQFANSSQVPFSSAHVVDTLPPGLIYAKGTGLIDGKPLEPVVHGSILDWAFTSLGGGENHTLTYATVVSPNVADGASLVNNVTVSGTAQGATASASSSATIQVGGGAFASVQVITGRVFTDKTNTGYFHRGDKGVPGVRVYLEDGESVLTDKDGRFSFPGANPGMHVLRLDPMTFPSAVHAFGDNAFDSPRSTQRLVHGILDAGMLRDVNFALEGP